MAVLEEEEPLEGIDDDAQSKCTSTACDMDIEQNLPTDEELELDFRRSYAELEAAARKHEMVVEMQGLVAASTRIRAFLERSHRTLLYEVNDADEEAMLLGMMIETNNCVAIQLDRLESKIAGSRTLLPVVVDSLSSSSNAVASQKPHCPDVVSSTTSSLVAPEKVDSLGPSIIRSSPMSATPEGKEDNKGQMARAA